MGDCISPIELCGVFLAIGDCPAAHDSPFINLKFTCMTDRLPSHDDFIRNILSNKRNIISYFRKCLPSGISERLDFSKIRQIPGTYISDSLKKTMADIVFACPLKGGKEEVRICLLIEHKSRPDKFTPIQMGGYIFSALQKQIRDQEPLSLVIPILLYHGGENWEYRTLENLFPGLEEDFRKYLPTFDFVYNNLGQIGDSELESLNNRFLAASLLALKHSREKDWLEQNAVRLFVLASEGSKGLRKGFIIYFSGRSKLDEKLINSLPEPVKTDIMNTLDTYYEKGLKAGIQEGMEKGMEKGIERRNTEIIQNLIKVNSFSDAEIAKLTGVTVSYVRRIRSAMNRNN